VLVFHPNFSGCNLNFGPTFVASNLHFWTFLLYETASMAPKVNINWMGIFLDGLWFKLDGALLDWITDSISITQNSLCWFSVLTLAVVVMNYGPTFVASNLHFWTVPLHETASMAPKVNID
jgi:hypothetical protein